MAVVEIRCPRCGSTCSPRDRLKGEYRCDHCGALFNFIDTRESTVVHDTRLHNCPLCGRPVKIEEAFICTQCQNQFLCPNCVQEVAGKFVCNDCLKKKWLIVGPSQICPNCNRALAYIPDYNRWYCYNCGTYVQHVCSKCGGNSRYVKQYNSWWCDTCREYLKTKQTQVESLRQPVNSPNPQPIIIQTQPQQPKSGCFIATAAYGTPMATEIDTLRHFRDRRLVPNLAGRRLVGMYYFYSPPIANVISRNEKMRALVRIGLKPIIAALRT